MKIVCRLITYMDTMTRGSTSLKRGGLLKGRERSISLSLYLYRRKGYKYKFKREQGINISLNLNRV